MSNIEHYFENLLYHGKDIKGEPNKEYCSKDQLATAEMCANYVIYNIFGNREKFIEFMGERYD